MVRRQIKSRNWARKQLVRLITAIAILFLWPGYLRAATQQITAVVLHSWPPQYQVDASGRPTGFAIDIIEQVAASANMTVTYKLVTSWEEASEALLSGRADLIPNLGITPERQKSFAFTSPVETFPVVIFVRQSTTGINSQADLGGRVVATVQYNTGTRLMRQRKDIDQRVFSNVNEALLDLLAGQVDALIYPHPVLMKLAIDSGLEDRIKVAGPPLLEIKRAISVRKDNAALLNRLEPVVEKYVRSAAYEQVYAKWYGRPKPFWTPRRIVWAMGGLIFIIAVWLNLRTSRVNRRLKQSVADQKRAESRLRRSEEKYRLIVENQNDLIVKLDAVGRLRFASPSFLETFVLPMDDLMGSHLATLIHYEDRQKAESALQRLQAPPHASSHEGRALTPKGWRWFSWSNKAMVDHDGRIIEIVAVGRDVTERKYAESKLQASEEKFRAIFEQAADGVVLLNLQTMAVADFNAAAHTALGYAAEEFGATSLRDLVVPGPLDSTPKVIEKLLDCQGYPVEVMLRHKSGKVRHFRIKQRRLKVNGGKYLLSLWHDITDRKLLEEQLLHTQKMEAIGTLAGGVAHDFNNILSIIMGNTELAIEDISEEHCAKSKLREIQTASKRAREVVRQLLAFSRQEQENRTLVMLAPLIDESLQLLRASIPSTIEIRKHILSDDLALMADATQIHQVLINLCNNAAQAMESGGGAIDVSLLSTVMDEASASHFGIKTGTYAQIRVEDTGRGMGPEILERIFDPYFTTKNAQQGTGMGLSIVHGIVTRHNGVIDVKSRPGVGTVFKVFLPQLRQVRPGRAPLSETVSKGNESILLVDDEPAIILFGRKTLEKLGYRVQAVSSAAEALARFKADPSQFDLIITDRTMPGMTGEALAREILNIDPGMPIVLCSGQLLSGDDKRGQVSGIKAFLQKPYSIKTLANTIRRALAGKMSVQGHH